MEQLKLSDIRKPLNFRISKGLSCFNIEALATNKYDVVLDFDVYLPTKKKNLQRDFCWDHTQKQQLIFSMLKGINIPTISIIQYKDHISKGNSTIYKIIDGKQRLSTMIDFFSGHFPLIVNGREYFYGDLDEVAQRIIKLYEPLIDVVYEYWDDIISDDQKIAWFEMINFAGTPQDTEHLNNLKL